MSTLTLIETGNLIDIAKNLINLIIYIAGFVAVGYIIYGGYVYLMAGGDSANTEKAKKTLLYAIIGLVVVMISYAIIDYITKKF